MMYKLPLPEVKPLLDGKTWQLVHEFSIHLGTRQIIIPGNFETDFASIPWFFRRMFQPATGKHRIPALIHDYLYRVQYTTRKEADDLFLRAMELYGVTYWKRYLIYSAVRVGGWAAWSV